METKIMQVYYDSSAYPFKDQARETRYPVIGTSFTGASNTTRIRFYVNQFANIGTCTFVAITKLPSGKKLYEQLSKDTTSDTEPFVYLDISSAYTQEKGDIQIALNVYEGGVNISVDSDSGLYTISGSPIITATGNIKISVAYTPYMDTNYGSVPEISVQQALALVSGKLDETSGIIVIDSIGGISATTFTNGQMVYDKSTDVFYQVVSGEYVKQTLVDIAYEYTQSDNDVILTIKLSDGLGVYKTLTINLTTYLASITYVSDYTYSKDYVDTELAKKVDKTTTINGYALSSNVDLTKGDVGLGNVDNVKQYPYTSGVNLDNKIDTEITNRKALAGHSIDMTIDSNFDLVIKLLNANGLVISQDDVDLPLESIVVSATYYNTYTYQGVTYEKVIVIVLATTDVPTIVPVGDLVSGLVSVDELATALAGYYTKQEVDTLLSAKANSSDVYNKTQVDTLLGGKQDTLVSGTTIKTINNTTLLGSGNYAFDTAFNELSTNALENQVVAKEFREINYELAIIRESLFEVVLSEIDYSVDYASIYTIPERLIDTDGTHRVVYSETQLKEIEGNTLVVNQLCWRGISPVYWNVNLSLTSFSYNDTTKRYTLKSQSASTYWSVSLNDNTIGSHIYLVVLNVITYSARFYLQLGSTDYSRPISASGIYYRKITGNGTAPIGLKTENQNTNDTVIEFNIIDLTQMFNGNIPQDLLDNPSHFSWYYNGDLSYNTGSLYNSNVSGLMIRGFNQWDEETELGTIDNSTGQNVSSTTQIRSKNFIKVIPNKDYWFGNSTPNGTFNLIQYDKNYNFIKSSLNFRNTQRTIDVNCEYIRFYMAVAYGTIYNNDICINVSNDNLNGQYKHFVENTISVPQTELISAGSVHNNLQVVEGNIVEGEQLYNIVKNENGGSVDLGTLDWTKGSGFISAKLTNSKADNSLVPNCITNYSGQIISFNSFANNPYPSGLTIRADNENVYIRNSDYTTAQLDNLIATLAGKYLNYELATPTQTIVATDLHFDQVSSLIEQGGTITMLNSGTPINTTTTFVVKKAVGE